MTPRIKELAEQAGFRSDVTVTDGNNKIIDTKTSIALEKFAELIVRECSDVADENYIHRGSRTCGLAIRLHFGVEE